METEDSPIMHSPLFITQKGNEVICELCPHNCNIKSGCFGLCGVRGNKGGKGIIPFYGYISALAVDPIEKKPLYHFKPGTQILSIGFYGCNFRCPFCQNWHISQSSGFANRMGSSSSGSFIKPDEIISSSIRKRTPSIAYTYSESLVHIEYTIDCMKLAHKQNIANVLVTNGCINHKAAVEVLEYTDAVNVDLKCFSAATYKECLNGDLQTVLDFIQLVYKKHIHLEITTLIVPGLNDSKDEISSAADFICSIDKDIPWHLTAYRPEYRWNAPPTDPGFLLHTANEAKKKLSFVYTGNIAIK
ncbi:MAG: AmmeMemoRadiSam system radical SAM enzyme [Treponema sp.]|jgi:pyruvate formate lyase activating enzyme|nr:AmmeMemoRadiSam system radical SAM enzyme [Treponema sp.]